MKLDPAGILPSTFFLTKITLYGGGSFSGVMRSSGMKTIFLMVQFMLQPGNNLKGGWMLGHNSDIVYVVGNSPLLFPVI